MSEPRVPQYLACRFVLSGANIMAPGLTSPGATIHDEVGWFGVFVKLGLQSYSEAANMRSSGRAHVS